MKVYREKGGIIIPFDEEEASFDAPSPVTSRARTFKLFAVAFFAVKLILYTVAQSSFFDSWDVSLPSFSSYKHDRQCPQEDPLLPTSAIINKLKVIYSTESFQNRSAAWLSGAVQIP